MEPDSSELRRLATIGLPGGIEQPVVARSLNALLQHAQSERVLMQLHMAVAENMVANATDDWRQQVREAAAHAAATTLATQSQAATAVTRMRAAGVQPIVLKGVATAYLDYDRPFERWSSDADLLVDFDDVDTVRQIFHERPQQPTRGRRWADQFGHAITLANDDNVHLDIHTRLTPGYIGNAIRGEELRKHRDAFEIGGVELTALDGAGRLLHAALHARTVGVSLQSHLDVPRLVLASKVDWRTAIERSIDWRIDYFFALGIRSTWRCFDLPDHAILDWADLHRPRGRQRLVQLVAGERPRGNMIAGPIALPPSKWVPYSWPILFPPSDYAEAKNRNWRVNMGLLRSELRQR